MESYHWFDWESKGSSEPSRWVAMLKPILGGMVGLLFWLVDHRVMAMVVWGITALITAISMLSPAGARTLNRLFISLGTLVGRVMTVLLLTPLVWLVFPVVRVYNRLARRDALHLRDRMRHTFWLEADSDRRKRRYVGAMFVTENALGRTRTRLATVAIVCILVIFAEIMLRCLGIGSPILYVDDPIVGYYPGPNQSVHRHGDNRLETNQFGMRAPNYTVEKPAGGFRILMIGDSTLWGGSYMDQDDIYARLVEKKLRQVYPGSTVEVLNIGVNGWGPYHKLGYVERFGTFDADLAIVCMPIGDVGRYLSRLVNIPYFPVNSPPRLAMEEVFLKLVWRYKTRLNGPPSVESQAIQNERGIQTYVELARYLRAKEIEVLFEVLPSREAGISGVVPESEMDLVRHFQSALEAETFPMGYPKDFLADHSDAEVEDLYHDVCHLHWLGHQIYADYLVERISSVSDVFAAWSTNHRPMVVYSGGR